MEKPSSVKVRGSKKTETKETGHICECCWVGG